ncbi:hypothetical protein ANANG_G00150880 [Anguilla anguilla]|uniref:Lysosomal proton-coupled steroid conjugate and bile acid symporter SLC46A3 n=1 Tax=Anguilla anguilla TaxID=7936 RepID=A0A9D3RVR3_ANGAN|nr:hypothetical protein ANANG_G00150880 [Anguilla anguilla]
MRRLYLVEPVVAMYAFAMFMTYPLLQQYIYRRLWEQLTDSPYTSSLNFSHCEDNNSNLSRQHEAVQKEASLFFLYSELCFLFPSLVMSLLLVSLSDHCGRKVAIITPLVGDFLFSLSYFLVSRYSLSLKLVLAASFLAGTMGGPTALIGGSFAYVADLCGSGRKTVRMAGLDMLLGVLSGLASLSTGFFIRTAGFSWPFFTAALLHLLNLAYASCLLAETVEAPASPAAEEDGGWRSKREALRARFQGVYLLFAASTRRRNTLLLLTLLAFAFYKLRGVYVLSRCLRDAHIALLGLLSVAIGMGMAAFTKTTLMMFLVRVPLLFSIMPAPVLRSMMSKIVLNSEQGALFACVAFVEMLSVGVAFTVFTSTYASSVSWFPGFSFLLASGLTLIPMALTGSVLCLRLDVDGETKALTGEDEAEAPGETLQMPSWDVS